MNPDDCKYLIDLCKMRIVDVESQVRKQAEGRCGMAGVRRILQEVDYLHELIAKLKPLEAA